MKLLRLTGFAVLLSALCTVAAHAQNAGQPEPLVITALNLMAGDARHQAVAERGGDSNALFAGDVVLYRLVFTNTTDVAVRHVEFKDPLPAALRYVGGSASADRDDVTVSYSIDGGRVYSAQPMIEATVDGKTVQQPAPPEMYTHIRWMVEGWVEPGAQVTAEFRAQLPDPTQHDANPGAGK